uniref:non-specific serine/threonine protein kinase n=1 Tax=Aegilops tauschii subsp. strangulata TaxID=200361 RepID=A0A453FBU8_AEGTS
MVSCLGRASSWNGSRARIGNASCARNLMDAAPTARRRNSLLACAPAGTAAAAAPPLESKRKYKMIIAGSVAGAAVFIALAAVAVLFIRKRRQRKVVNSSSKLLKYRYSGSGGTPTRSRGGDMESGSSQDMGNRFSYEELEEATDSFNENRELGDGGFGTVYKGYLGDGRVVAVKRLYNNSYRRVEQFVNEAAILARLRHPNLVMFYGCTSKESRELLLVYEFVQNGTVADHLHGPRAAERALPWPLRLSIAVESAAALTYLHAIEPPIVHRDVKTNNILLDTDFHVKVADFGLSRLFPLDATHVSTAPQGTPGYVDPEYHQCYQLTDKSDVYSFGVVLVELISSKPAVDITRQRNEINLAGMAISKIQKCRLEELVDVELGYESDPAARKMMTMVAELAFRCLQQNGEMRPPIREVLDVLRAIQDECLGHKDGGGKGKKDFAEPFSPNTVHAPWDSTTTTPNTSQ